ncbi:MAG: carbonic anhydrase [Aeromicrobium sp.]
MTVTDEFVEANKTYQQDFNGPLPLPPARQIAVVACMDARLDPAKILGIEEGDAHVIRNAGGVVTEDALRSLAISQRLLGTTEIVLVHHTDCGMVTFTDDGFRQDIEKDTGIRPTWSAEAFPDAAADVTNGINRIKANPFIPNKDNVRGFVFDVATGAINEVSAA